MAGVISANAAALGGKVVIDAVNRMGEPEVDGHAAIAAAAPTARYVRAFSTLGWENFADPPAGRGSLLRRRPGRPRGGRGADQGGRARPPVRRRPGRGQTVDGVLPLWFSLVQQHGGNRKLAFRVVRS